MYKNKFFALFFLITIGGSGIAQPVYFQKIFGDTLTQSIGKSVLQITDGSIYFIGNFNNFSTSVTGICLFKMDSTGNILWQKNLLTGPAYANRMIYTTYNTLLINGQFTDSSGNTNALVIHLDTSGNVIFSNTYGKLLSTEAFQSLLQTLDGGFIFTGFITNPSGPGNAFWIVKTDSAGNEQWQQTFGYNVNATSDDIVQTPDGGYLVTGDKKTASSNYNVHAVKIDANGGLMWETDLTFPYNSGCKNMIINSEGNYIVIGEAATASSAYFDPFITKMDTAGNIIWSHSIPCSNNGDAGYDIIESSPGNYLITGFGYNVAAATSDMLIMQLDSLGNEVNTRYYGNNGYDQGFTIVKDYNQTGFLAAGFISVGNENKYFLVHDDLLVTANTVNEVLYKRKVTIYPNPAFDKLHINITGFSKKGMIKFSDLLGNVILTAKIDDFFVIQTLDYSPGLYLLEVSDGFNYEKSKVIIVH